MTTISVPRHLKALVIINRGREPLSSLLSLCEGNPLVINGFLSQRVTNVELLLTHWGRVRHICVSKLTTIGSDNGLSPDRRQAIIWTNAGILLIRTNFRDFLSEIQEFLLEKMHLKMLSGKWRPSCLGLNVLSSIRYRYAHIFCAVFCCDYSINCCCIFH